MTREIGQVVRQPVSVAVRSHRRLEERLRLRFPRANVLLSAAIWRVYSRLPARSPLRQAIVRHTVRVGLEAHNRGDFESTLSHYHPEGESYFDARIVALGFEPMYRGREARMEAQRQWMAEWDGIRFDVDQLIDLGDDRLLLLGHLRGTGLSSGAEVEIEIAFLYTFSAGLTVHEKVFSTHEEALEAVGLTE